LKINWISSRAVARLGFVLPVFWAKQSEIGVFTGFFSDFWQKKRILSFEFSVLVFQ
jgi:hypothetical protein